MTKDEGDRVTFEIREGSGSVDDSAAKLHTTRHIYDVRVGLGLWYGWGEVRVGARLMKFD